MFVFGLVVYVANFVFFPVSVLSLEDTKVKVIISRLLQSTMVRHVLQVFLVEEVVLGDGQVFEPFMMLSKECIA